MYVNFRLLNEKGFTYDEFMALAAINQKEASIFKGMIPYDKFEELELISYIKGKEPKDVLVRLSKNGKAFFDALTTKKATQEILDVVTELVDMYESYGKESGNSLEVRDRLLWFIDSTGFNLHVIKSAVEDYLLDQSDYTLRLDNLIWKPQSSAFSVNYSLSDSKLFQIITRKYKIPINFFLVPNSKKSAKDNWLFDIMKLKVPKGLDEEYYWTGSYNSDNEKLKHLKKLFLK